MLKIFKPKPFVWLIVLLSSSLYSQSFKEKMKAKFKKDKSAMYECGYVQKEKALSKFSPTKLIGKAVGGTAVNGGNSDLGKAAISVFYQANLHPLGVIKYPTKTPGWETCGDAVFAGFTNRDGVGFSSTDGTFKVDDTEVSNAGYGTYFHGFSPQARGEKVVSISSSNGNKAKVIVSPGKPLAIKTIDGKAKGEAISIDGTKDIVIELMNGDVDPKSNLHVQMICKLTGTAVIYDIIVTKAKNTIYIPKEAFKNFEGSPSPFADDNLLIVNRVSEKVIEGTDAGAIRTLSAYMDWTPINATGDIAKGSIVTAGFDESKNTKIDIELNTKGEYNLTLNKPGPFYSPPLKFMKKVAIASFVVRGNLAKKGVQGDWLVNKWFPEIQDKSWQLLVDAMYSNFANAMQQQMELELVPLETIKSSNAYQHAKTIQGGATQTKVEVAAGGTKRILSTSSDIFKDLSISFPADFVSERLIKELDIDAVIAVTVDLDFNFETEGLDPKIYIEAFAPNVSYKTSAKYFSLRGWTDGKSLAEAKELKIGDAQSIYGMIKAEALNEQIFNALNQLSERESEYPVYEELWKAKL